MCVVVRKVFTEEGKLASSLQRGAEDVQRNRLGKGDLRTACAKIQSYENMVCYLSSLSFMLVR